MPRRINGGVIGVANLPTTATASGVWSMFEVELSMLQQDWPLGILVDYLVVAGGGGGDAGGGGGGGFRVGSNLTLAQEQQMLAFEPPLFAGKATLGGTLACNLSGPERPWSGSIRDMLLGVQLVNGKAEVLNFGGRVMKNVAGYDVSRLQAGALGTLGIISEISLKVMPQPEYSLTLVYEMSAEDALATMNQRATESRPLNAAFWAAGQLYLRIAGAASAVSHTAILWGGEQHSEPDSLWAQLREMSLPFFAGDEPLWRLSLGSTTPLAPGFGDTLIDWGGAQRWLRGEQDLAALQASTAGGHASLIRGGDRNGELRVQPGGAGQRLHQRLKHSFDPLGIINPGRLYSWL